MAAENFQIDALLPPDMAVKAQELGIRKAQMGSYTMFVLAILAGAFISLGAVASTTMTTGAAGVLPFGVTRFLSGIVFSLGLILVIVGGAELFTGNNLIVMAWASGAVSTRQLLRNWSVVYIGNFVGALLSAVAMFLTNQYMTSGGALGLNALTIAKNKSELGFVQAIALGTLCNALVCLAVWLCYSARSTTDKILSIIFPISAFVAAGFEHSIANMYFIPIGLLIKQFAPSTFWEMVQKSPADFTSLTWENFFVRNLIPVTVGNIIGGALMVGAVYWFVYLRHKRSAASPQVSPDSME
jgi:formate transporter